MTSPPLDEERGEEWEEEPGDEPREEPDPASAESRRMSTARLRGANAREVRLYEK